MIIAYILFLLLLCLVVVIAVTCSHFKKAAYNNGQKRDVIIVLGYPAKKDGSISPILRERINKAAKLYHEPLHIHPDVHKPYKAPARQKEVIPIVELPLLITNCNKCNTINL